MLKTNENKTSKRNYFPQSCSSEYHHLKKMCGFITKLRKMMQTLRDNAEPHVSHQSLGTLSF